MYGIFSFFFLIVSVNNKKILCRLSQHFIIIQSDQDLCPLTKLMNTMEYITGTIQ